MPSSKSLGKAGGFSLFSSGLGGQIGWSCDVVAEEFSGLSPFYVCSSYSCGDYGGDRGG